MTLEEARRAIAEIEALDSKKDWEAAHCSEDVLLHRFVYAIAQEPKVPKLKRMAKEIADHLSSAHTNAVRYYS